MPMSDYMQTVRSKVGNLLLEIPSVSVLHFDDQDRVLLVYHSDVRLWTTPGGAVEPAETPANAAVREMAWRRFREFFGRRPLPERIAAAQRLRHAPELEVKYLDSLVSDLSGAGGVDEELEGALSHLADALRRQRRYAEAAQRLQSLYDLQRKRSSSQVTPTGLRLLDARLRNGAKPRVADLIRELSATDADDVGTGIIQTISAYLDDVPNRVATDKLSLLLDELRTVEAESLGKAWAALLARLGAICAAGEARTDSSTSGTEPNGP